MPGFPSDAQLFTTLPGYLASFMASRGIKDMDEGLRAFLDQAEKFHASRGRNTKSYVESKTRLKGRQFGTLNNLRHKLSVREEQATDKVNVSDGEQF